MDAKLDTVEEADEVVVDPQVEKGGQGLCQEDRLGEGFNGPSPARASRTAPYAFQCSQHTQLLKKREDPLARTLPVLPHTRGKTPALFQSSRTFRNTRSRVTMPTMSRGNSLRTTILLKGSTPTMWAGFMTLLRFPSATTLPHRTRPILVPWHHFDVNMFPSRTSSGRKSTDK
jgi:hypothetical protein